MSQNNHTSSLLATTNCHPPQIPQPETLLNTKDIYQLVDLPTILQKNATKEIFLVTGKQSYINTQANALLKPILSNYKVTQFSEFQKNPTLQDIQKGIAIYQKKIKSPAITLAVGGGSVLDMAKLINCLAKQTLDAETLIKDPTKIQHVCDKLIAIPTTAGSGSEATHFAVAYIDNKKYSVAHPKFMQAQYVILESRLTASMSKHLTAVTGLDALCQAIESFWAVAATDESQHNAKQAIKLLLNNLVPAVNSPTEQIRQDMQLAAYYAGKAINISKTTAAHACSYPLTIFFNIPHGHAVALTIAEYFLLNAAPENRIINDSGGRENLAYKMEQLINLFGAETAIDCYTQLKSIIAKIGLINHISDLNLTADDIEKKILPNINLQRLRNNPVAITENDLKKIFKLSR